MPPNVSTAPNLPARSAPWLWAVPLAVLLAGVMLLADATWLKYALWGAAGVAAAFLAAAVYRKPMLGAWLLVFFSPFSCILFRLTLPRPADIAIRPYDLLVLLVLPTLFFKKEASPVYESTSWTRPTLTTWILFLFGAFALWGTVPMALADNLSIALFGYLRFMANFLLIAYLIKFVNTAEKLVSLLKVYCVIGCIMAATTILTTFYAFEYKWPMLLDDSFSMEGKFALFNTASGFLDAVRGLKAGVGIAGKQESVQVFFTAELFTLYLLLRAPSAARKCLMMLAIVLFETVKYQLIAKAAIVGSYLVILGIVFLAPKLRNHLVAIFFGFTVLNGIGFEAAYLLRPEHMKHMESFSASVQTQFKSKSSYEQGSFSWRVHVWNKALRRIGESPVFGKGPDSLGNNFVFRDPHGLNLFLSAAADYGIPGAAFMTAIFLLAGVKIFSILKKGGDLPPQYWLLPYCIVGGVLFNLMDYCMDNFIYWPEIWLKLGLVLCCVRIWPLLRAGTPPRNVFAAARRPALAAASALVLLAPQSNATPLRHPDNRSGISMEGGVPKLSINGEPLNNMFGVYVYCTAVDPNTERFREDMKEVIRKAAALKIPVISFDILWSDYDRSLDPPADAKSAANRLPTENLDSILDFAAQSGVYVVLQVPVHAHWGLPRWWKAYGQNRNAYQLVDPASDRGSRYNSVQSPVASYGGFSHHELLRALVRKLVLKYRSHPAVIGWGINTGPTGENGYAPNYLELKFNRNLQAFDYRLAMADYSPLARQQFIDWLRERYSSIDALNAAWSSSYDRFESIAPPFPKAITPQETLEANGDSRPPMKDWQRYRYDALMDEWRFLSNLVRELDPGKIVIGKTSWTPQSIDTGSRSMLSTATGVLAERLIDADKIDGGITRCDDLPQFVPTSSGSRIDFYHLAAFSRAQGVVRIACLENWVKTESPELSQTPIPEGRALEIKNLLRQQGAYLWFVVALECDPNPKPDWSWKEVTRVVEKSTQNELSGIRVKKPVAAFFYSLDNTMAHYNAASPELQTSALSRAVAGAFFQADVDYTFLEAQELAQNTPDPAQIKLVVLGDQRYLSPKGVSKLRDYVNKGGCLLMVGSNGTFGRGATPDPSALDSLAPGLTPTEKKAVLHRGNGGGNTIPAIFVNQKSVRFSELPGDDPLKGYTALKELIGSALRLKDGGKLNLSAPFGHFNALPPGPRGGRHTHAELMQFISDFDREGRRTVFRDQFPGPKDVFDSFDTNHDGKVTEYEDTSDSK